MFAFFEKLIKPFPPQEPEEPPKSLYAFCRHYTRGIEPHLIIMSILTGLIALLEVSLFAFLGKLVDLLADSQPDTFMQDAGNQLWLWALLVLVGLPLLVFFHSLIIHQTLLGNYPMSIRWQAHRYLLGQSLSFYQNELAGRIATKVMQTSLAVREAVLKLLDVMLYIVVYFGGIVIVVASMDIRLTIPFIIWLILYLGIMYVLFPRLEAISSMQADARSEMTGRIVACLQNSHYVITTDISGAVPQLAPESNSKSLKSVIATSDFSFLPILCQIILHKLPVIGGICFFKSSLKGGRCGLFFRSNSFK